MEVLKPQQPGHSTLVNILFEDLPTLLWMLSWTMMKPEYKTLDGIARTQPLSLPWKELPPQRK